MSWLVDTNILSELRKGARADAGVRTWFAAARDDERVTSVLVLGELRRGVESIRRMAFVRDVSSVMRVEGAQE